MGGRSMAGDELVRYAERFAGEHIDITEKQCRVLVKDLLHDRELMRLENKAIQKALDGVIRGQSKSMEVSK